MPQLKANGKRVNGKQGGSWITPTRRLAIYLRDGFKCCYCGKDLSQVGPRDITLDHVKPQCQGGHHDTTNLITACLGCNSRRQHLPVRAFLVKLYGGAEKVKDAQEVLHVDFINLVMKGLRASQRRSIRKHLATAKSIIASRTNPVELQHHHCPKEV